MSSVVAQKRVLVVDDSKFVRTTFNRILSAWFAVREEADGEAGWEALQSDASIAMVFSDLDMPKLDGFALIERIRKSADARIRGLPVVIISGSQDESSRRRAREAGANDFISKSADAPEVLARIGNLMRLVKPAAATPQLLVTEGHKQFSYARRHGTQLSVMALRVDSFADAAGKFGKRVADELLARIGKLVASMMRAEDTVGLAAEATFMVLSPGTGPAQALAFARRLREQLLNAQVSYGGQVLKIQASVGCASFGVDAADSIEELMKRALQRLQTGNIAPKPALLAAEVERALQVLERLDAEGLGDAAAREIVRRLAPFMQRALKRAS
ncbi:MAG: response regulator [Betaproteobacteria bacterium]|nr:MAG: response regulator [Betaproteobacteria bacterium]